jgi:hypothetical protein
MSILATIRPDDWNFPLLLHVFGALTLLGALVTAGSAMVIGWKHETAVDAITWARISFRTLLIVALPAWFLMRIGAEWIASKEGWSDVDEEPLWLGLGYLTAEAGGLLLLITIILSGVGARRLARSDAESGGTLVRVATVLALLLVVAYVIVTWAMSAKPD